MPSYCLNCLHIGHSKDSCILLNGSRPAKAPNPNVVVPAPPSPKPTGDNPNPNKDSQPEINHYKWVEVGRKPRLADAAGPSHPEPLQPSPAAAMEEPNVEFNNLNRFNVLQEDHGDSNIVLPINRNGTAQDLNNAVPGISAATNPLFVENMDLVSSPSSEKAIDASAVGNILHDAAQVTPEKIDGTTGEAGCSKILDFPVKEPDGCNIAKQVDSFPSTSRDLTDDFENALTEDNLLGAASIHLTRVTSVPKMLP